MHKATAPTLTLGFMILNLRVVIVKMLAVKFYCSEVLYYDPGPYWNRIRQAANICSVQRYKKRAFVLVRK